MNKKQKIVLWVCICLFSLILLFPRYSECIVTFEGKLLSQGSWDVPITRIKLCIILSVVCAGLIATFMNKNRESS